MNLLCSAHALETTLEIRRIPMNSKRMLLAIAAVLIVPTCSYAQGAKACEELKTEIAAKLDAKGVKGYTLEIVAKDADAPGKSVGTCEGGTKKIMYSKGDAAATKPEKKEPTKE
jgi:hypothetical protein